MTETRTALLAACVLAGLPVCAGADSPGRQLDADSSPLATLVDSLPEMSELARLELAGLIVERVLEAYEQELEAVRLEFERGGSDPARLARWYRATTPILAELRSAEAEIPMAEALDIRADRQGQVLLLVDGRALWVSWPRPSAQARLERALVETFCTRHPCPGRADPETEMPVLAIPVETLTGQWTLLQNQPPTWTSAAGVRCEFADMARRPDKEALCRSLVAELDLLASVLRRAQRRGEPLEWSAVTLGHELPGGEQALVVNSAGDFLTVVAPLLAAEPIDWPEARRWLEARVDGRAAQATVRRAGASR